VLPVARERAFAFFEDPRNLLGITPGWLQFRMARTGAGVREGAVFDYTIKWCGLGLSWRSRIEDYRPPERFTDVQAAGPYRRWEHLHLFEEAPEGTSMRDEVLYRLPFGSAGELLHAFVVRRQLEEIFSYRAVRIEEWARGELERKAPET
jgi:ligand-binding SRPBCC domain-containing protein